MAPRPAVPPAVDRAYAALRQSGMCELPETLQPLSVAGGWSFQCVFRLTEPNPSGLPARITLKALVRDSFPFTPVEFYPDVPAEDLTGFPHQDAETGKLCLPPEYRAPADESSLRQYTAWASEWIEDAANGTLLNPGDPYELPDFSCKQLKHPLADLPVFVDESPTTLRNWLPHLSQTGVLELIVCTRPRGVFVRQFLTDNHRPVRRAGYSDDLFRGCPVVHGVWILLPDIILRRHRAPFTFDELATVCKRHAISVERVLKRAWRGASKHLPAGVLLVGFPIPAVVGGPPAEIHWQPILLPDKIAIGRQIPPRKKGRRDEGQLWRFARDEGPLAPSQRMYWGKVENISASRMTTRGAHPAAVCACKVVLFGCGALGSAIAEGLIRGGVRTLTCVDGQTVEFGNLCRHTLEGRDVGRYKALALADRLGHSFPHVTVTGLATGIPSDGLSAERWRLTEAMMGADVLIDCTTDHAAFQWLSGSGRGDGKMVATLFIDPHATVLTLVLSGRNTAAFKVHARLMDDIAAGATPIDPGTYFSDISPTELVLPGAGCWHPTFPALGSHITMIACAALDHLAAWMSEPAHCNGAAVLLRRTPALGVGPVVETVFRREYR